VSAGLDRTTKLTVGVVGMTRAATGGMLATALTVAVGRRGSPLAVGLLGSVFFLSMMVFAPLWGSLGDALDRRRAVLVGLSSLSALVTLGFVAVRSVPGIIGLRFVYAVFAVSVGPVLLTSVSALGGPTRPRASPEPPCRKRYQAAGTVNET
jgi:MFS family permease